MSLRSKTHTPRLPSMTSASGATPATVVTNNNNDLNHYNINLKLPVNAQPTEVLAARFVSWRKIIRALNVYFKEVASVQEEVVRHNVRLGHAVSFPFFANGTSDGNTGPAPATAGHLQMGSSLAHKMDENEQTRHMFLEFGSGSIADVPGNMIQYHRSQAAAASRISKELSQNIIPRLEDLRRDLVVKIKEIKNLQSDFKNSVEREQNGTAKDLQQYVSSIDILNRNPSLLPPKHDPYLVKQSLDKQIGRQITEENYLLEAFQNLQGSGKELEKVVAQEVQQALTTFGKLMAIQGKNLTELMADKILHGFVATDPTLEWESFVHRDTNFVDAALKPRKPTEVVYPHQNSELAYEVKSGYLERRSKYLKSYSRAWYVLTPSFLHEFKSPDRKKDAYPVMSLSLDECQLSHDAHRSTSISHKFVINAKQQGSGSKGHNWVFRAESQEKLDEWYNSLKQLTSISDPISRAKSLRAAVAPASLQVPNNRSSANSRPGSSRLSNEISRSPPLQQPQQQAAAFGAAFGAGAGAAAAAVAVPTTPRSSNHAAPAHTSIDPLIVNSPVPSDTSGVTSNGEPYQDDEEEFTHHTENMSSSHYYNNHHHDDAAAAAAAAAAGATGDGVAAGVAAMAVDDNDPSLRQARGRFPSSVNLETNPVDPDRATDAETLHREAASFVVPSDRLVHPADDGDDDDNASVFSYDRDHPSASTYKANDDFRPVDSDLPVEVERRLTQTDHKHDPDANIRLGPARKSTADDVPIEEQILERRSSVASQPRSRPQRKATGSYGTSDELKPLSEQHQQQQQQGQGQGLFFAEGLPSTTGGREN